MRSADAPGSGRLRLRFADRPAAQGAVLRLDPISDRGGVLRARRAPGRPATREPVRTRGFPTARGDRLGLRIASWGVEQWGAGAAKRPGSVLDELDDPDVRCLVRERRDALDARRAGARGRERPGGAVGPPRRAPPGAVRVVDEAHNVCPAAPADALTALATEHAVRIAGEGRKFGIDMLVATQRPQKVHENVISSATTSCSRRLDRQPTPHSSPSCSGSRPRGWWASPRISASARRLSRARSHRTRRCCGSATCRRRGRGRCRRGRAAPISAPGP